MSRTSYAGILVIVMAIVPLLLSSCSAPGSSAAAPTTVDGEELFSSKAIGSKPGCVTCHSLVPERRLVGPSLAGVNERAAQRIEGTGAADYIRQSITDPGSHIVEGFTGSAMPNGYSDILSDEQIDAVVTYLMEGP